MDRIARCVRDESRDLRYRQIRRERDGLFAEYCRQRRFVRDWHEPVAEEGGLHVFNERHRIALVGHRPRSVLGCCIVGAVHVRLRYSAARQDRNSKKGYRSVETVRSHGRLVLAVCRAGDHANNVVDVFADARRRAHVIGRAHDLRQHGVEVTAEGRIEFERQVIVDFPGQLPALLLQPAVERVAQIDVLRRDRERQGAGTGCSLCTRQDNRRDGS